MANKINTASFTRFRALKSERELIFILNYMHNINKQSLIDNPLMITGRFAQYEKVGWSPLDDVSIMTPSYMITHVHTFVDLTFTVISESNF